MAEVIRLPRGRWQPGRESDTSKGGFGLLVLSGFLIRRVGRDRRFGAELLGSGDLLRPWDHPPDVLAVPFSANWRVIRQARLALLDRRFAVRAAPYPEIATELISRAVLRSRQLTRAIAIAHNPKVETRLELLLWSLAERWGVVGPDGVALSLPLTHSLLADLVAASRPTVTAALSALTERGMLKRQRDIWLLNGSAPGK